MLSNLPCGAKSMYVSLAPMVCLACDHKWMQETLQQVLIPVWIAHTKTLHCPHCGAGWKKLAWRAIEPDGTQPENKEK